MERKKYLDVQVCLCASGSPNSSSCLQKSAKGDNRYVVIACNNPDMHCMDPSFEDFSRLPPYNNLVAQVINRCSSPEIVTRGVNDQYRILGNPTSANKTNFRSYGQALFNLPAPLPKNIGLTGKGLSGSMDAAAGHYVAEGTPVTEIFDNKAGSSYQLAEVVVRTVRVIFLLLPIPLFLYQQKYTVETVTIIEVRQILPLRP